jgi:hypothetical protein
VVGRVNGACAMIDAALVPLVSRPLQFAVVDDSGRQVARLLAEQLVYWRDRRHLEVALSAATPGSDLAAAGIGFVLAPAARHAVGVMLREGGLDRGGIERLCAVLGLGDCVVLDPLRPDVDRWRRQLTAAMLHVEPEAA